MNINFIKNLKNSSNSRNIFIKHDLELSINEDEKFSFQQKKNRFSQKISKTELDLFTNETQIKPLNPEHNIFNNKIMNQIKSISKIIYKNNNPEKKQRKLHNILFSEQKHNYINNINNIKSTNNSINIRTNSLHNISNINYNNKNYKAKNNNSFSNKKYYFIKTEKDKMILPPINQFKYKIHRLKLNVNNNEDKEQEERMMKLYKGLEIINKNKFFI